MRTPKGPALAHALIDYGIEHDMSWVCFQDQTGECWTWKNPLVRAQKNITHGRENISPFYNPDDAALKKKSSYCDDCGEVHDDCHCDEEEEIEEIDYKTLYEAENETNIKCRRDMHTIRTLCYGYEYQLQQLKRLLRKLVDNSQIWPGVAGEAKDLLCRLEKEDEELAQERLEDNTEVTYQNMFRCVNQQLNTCLVQIEEYKEEVSDSKNNCILLNDRIDCLTALIKKLLHNHQIPKEALEEVKEVMAQDQSDEE